MTRRPALVVVVWDDAYALRDDDGTDGSRPYRVRTVGWVLADTPAAIKIAAELTPDGARGVTRIPRAIVISVQTLRDPASRA